MAVESEQRVEFWRLVRQQHGVVTRAQLRALGLEEHAVAHRVRAGRLHRVHRGVYAVGRPDVTRYGRWMAAVLACGPHAALSHDSAAALWRIRRDRGEPIELSVLGRSARVPGVMVHRRTALTDDDLTRCRSIVVTTPTATLIDLAPRLSLGELERAVSEADKLDLVDPEALRATLARTAPRPGVRVLREALDRRTFRLSDSELERLMRAIARDAGLPAPETRARLNGYRADFHWPELGLVVETDGLRYHRTPAQQAHDRERDQVHAAAGLTPLRFTHEQVGHRPAHVRDTLAAIAARLRAARG